MSDSVSIPEKREIPFEGLENWVNAQKRAEFQSLRKGKYPSKHKEEVEAWREARSFNP